MNFGNPNVAGIYRKVKAQAEALRLAGNNVILVYTFHDEIIIDSKLEKKTILINSLFNKVNIFYFKLPKILSSERFDFIYFRHFPINPLLIKLLNRFKKYNQGVKILCEIPTYPYYKTFRKGLNSSYLKALIDKILMPKLGKIIDRFVLFDENKYLFNTQVIKIDNGMEIPKDYFRDVSQLPNDRINLVAIASFQDWHGIDRVLFGMSKYKTNLPFYLHLIGTGPQTMKLKNIVNELGLKERVFFHGYLDIIEYNKILNICHIGISSLGIHRVNQDSKMISPLKSREYFGLGIPFIYGYIDNFLPQNYNFTLQISYNDEPVNMENIYSFYNRMNLLGFENVSKIMREFAIDNFSWSYTMRNVINYIKTEA